MFLALAGVFFTTRATWEQDYCPWDLYGHLGIKIYPCEKIDEKSEILLYLQVNKLAFQFLE